MNILILLCLFVILFGLIMIKYGDKKWGTIVVIAGIVAFFLILFVWIVQSDILAISL